MSGSASDLYGAEAWEEKYDPSRYQGKKTPVSRSGGRQQASGGCLHKESELHKASYLPKWWRDMQQAIFRRRRIGGIASLAADWGDGTDSRKHLRGDGAALLCSPPILGFC